MRKCFAGPKFRDRKILAIAALIMSGCAGSGLQHVQPNVASLDPDRAVVIFSFVTEKSIEGQEVELVWRGTNGEHKVGSIVQTPVDGPLRLYVLEVPGHALTFETLKIKVEDKWWAVYEAMTVELEAGAVIYVGRMAIQNIEYDSGKFTKAISPKSIRFGFSDQSDSDLALLKQSYAVFGEHTVSVRVPQDWGERSHTKLHVERRETKNFSSGPTAGEILLEILAGAFTGQLGL